jgi:hopanoid C-3 methylase HpnR
VQDLNRLMPARDLLPRRRKYFIGVLDPAASIEMTRGCPWDCSFCSAWTFYGRSYRKLDPQRIADEMARIQEPGVFLVDDVAFIQAEHGFAIGRELEKRRIRKRYYMETRGDVLLRNKEVFRYWRRLGLDYMFIGVEAVDQEALELHRKRVKLSTNFEALEFARSLGVMVAINIIADTDWDADRFRAIREWALSVPEIVNISVNTPYPGTETFLEHGRNLATRDYRLFDIQHAVLPTRMPLDKFYEELVHTQRVMNTKHLGLSALKDTALLAARLVARGQTNFVRMLWKWNSVFNPERQMADHRRPVKYRMRLPEGNLQPKDLYVLKPPPRKAGAAVVDVMP